MDNEDERVEVKHQGRTFRVHTVRCFRPDGTFADIPPARRELGGAPGIRVVAWSVQHKHDDEFVMVEDYR